MIKYTFVCDICQSEEENEDSGPGTFRDYREGNKIKLDICDKCTSKIGAYIYEMQVKAARNKTEKSNG